MVCGNIFKTSFWSLRTCLCSRSAWISFKDQHQGQGSKIYKITTFYCILPTVRCKMHNAYQDKVTRIGKRSDILDEGEEEAT